MSGVCSCPRCESCLETFTRDPDQPHGSHQWPEDSCPGNCLCSFESISKYSLQSRDNSGKHFVGSLQNPDSDGASAARWVSEEGWQVSEGQWQGRNVLLCLSQSENTGRKTPLECFTSLARVDVLLR